MINPTPTKCSISIVVPVWRDWAAFGNLHRALSPSPGDIEWIVAAVAPGPDEAELALRAGITLVACDQPNRGVQLNAGAHAAHGRALLFHHADSVLTPAHLASLRTAMNQENFVGGAFHRKFDERHPIMKRLESLERWRCIHGRALFGDQSIFVRRDIFADLRGFTDIPLMEDFEFSRRLRRAGQLDILDPPMLTSARRHASRGSWRTSLRNLSFLILFQCGMCPWRLHRWYYHGRPFGETARAGTVAAE